MKYLVIYSQCKIARRIVLTLRVTTKIVPLVRDSRTERLSFGLTFLYTRKSAVEGQEVERLIRRLTIAVRSLLPISAFYNTDHAELYVAANWYFLFSLYKDSIIIRISHILVKHTTR